MKEYGELVMTMGAGGRVSDLAYTAIVRGVSSTTSVDLQCVTVLRDQRMARGVQSMETGVYACLERTVVTQLRGGVLLLRYLYKFEVEKHLYQLSFLSIIIKFTNALLDIPYRVRARNVSGVFPQNREPKAGTPITRFV